MGLHPRSSWGTHDASPDRLVDWGQGYPYSLIYIEGVSIKESMASHQSLHNHHPH